MKEVDRLAATISKIDEDVGVAPKGAYLRTPLNEIIVNNSFTGKQQQKQTERLEVITLPFVNYFVIPMNDNLHV